MAVRNTHAYAFHVVEIGYSTHVNRWSLCPLVNGPGTYRAHEQVCLGYYVTALNVTGVPTPQRVITGTQHST